MEFQLSIPTTPKFQEPREIDITGCPPKGRFTRLRSSTRGDLRGPDMVLVDQKYLVLGEEIGYH